MLPCNAQWALGDWFEDILRQLEPGDIAACRLVSTTWREQVAAALTHLSAAACAAECEEDGEATAAMLAAAFPRLLSLHLQLGRRAGGAGTGLLLAPQPQLRLPSPAPALRQFCARLTLRRVALEAPGSRGPTWELCHISMCQLGGLPRLESLSLAGFDIAYAAAGAWGQLSRLTALELSNCCLREVQEGESSGGGESGSGGGAGGGSQVAAEAARGATDGPQPSGLMRVLRPLARLKKLALAGRVEWEGEGGGGAGASRGRALVGVGGFAQLEALAVDGDFCLPPEVWSEVAALPRLRQLAFRRPAWAGSLFEELALTDASLSKLAGGACQLEALALAGHPLITNAGVGHIARLAGLKELELRLDSAGLDPTTTDVGVTDLGLSQLSQLTSLASLKLGGYPLNEGGCGALAGLPGVTCLQLHGCELINDQALYRLSALVGELRDLALVDCPRVSDIGIAFLMRQAARLTSLDLSGSYRNLSDSGVASIAQARALRRLSLAHCQHVTEQGLSALLPRLKALEHLCLRGCPRLADQACVLLAAFAPLLETLDLDYCKGVGDAGVAALAGLRRLHRLRVHEAGASDKGLATLAARKAGRGLRMDSPKPRWWLAED